MFVEGISFLNDLIFLRLGSIVLEGFGLLVFFGMEIVVIFKIDYV